VPSRGLSLSLSLSRSFSSHQLSMASIMVVDTPGFQNPRHQGQDRAATFEELCHNYTHERLQLLAYQATFVSTLERHREVGVRDAGGQGWGRGQARRSGEGPGPWWSQRRPSVTSSPRPLCGQSFLLGATGHGDPWGSQGRGPSCPLPGQGHSERSSNSLKVTQPQRPA
jgi:hypothetical protein